jgi:acyl transferase domain-containing protein/acyl carrier protein
MYKETGLEIAVLGMSCRFPGANNLDEYWQNLINEKETISFFDEHEIQNLEANSKLASHNKYIKAAGILKNIDQFDAKLFNYTPREVELMDPQQRIWLEICWEALELTGLNPFAIDKSVGVYVASGGSDYFIKNLYSSKEFDEDNLWQLYTLNAASSLATSVAYNFNLRGPAVSIQTACSGSLVAIHQACRSLLCGDCELAIAGGISIFLPQKQWRPYQEGMILSPDGHCKAFDAAANGTVCSSGAGAVVLKRLVDAVKDNDNIFAVIKGSAVNNDGKQKIGYTAPSIEGQRDVILDALRFAEIDAENVDYIETHGTGTKLGDPIEIEALKEAFAKYTKKNQFCAIGSVKTNIGHTDAAAGIAGFIKTVLAINSKKIPAHLHFNTPNPNIDFANSPFFINQKTFPWKSNNKRCAGISSFGIGGTNSHLILVDADEYQPNTNKNFKPTTLICISGNSKASLEGNRNNLVNFLNFNPDVNLADLAYTLQIKKNHFAFKQIFIGDTVNSLLEIIKFQDPRFSFSSLENTSYQKIVFMFPGQGSQYLNMGKELYNNFSEYQYWFDYCSKYVLSQTGIELQKILFVEDANFIENNIIKDTYYAQLILFIVEFSLAKLWISLGVKPTALIGHSLGEYVAACLAEVFTIDDALKIISIRAKLMQQTAQGAMIAVSLSPESISNYLNDELTIAAVNTPNACVISGSVKAIDRFKLDLNKNHIEFTQLYTDKAFHSTLMAPIINEFKFVLENIHFQKPKLPLISNITGKFIDVDICNAEYWVKHLQSTVNFMQGLKTFKENNFSIYLEVGPGKQLSTFVTSIENNNAAIQILASLPSHKEYQEISSFKYFIMALGKLWLYGVNINFTKYYENEFRKYVNVPTYYFDRKKYWIEPSLPKEKLYQNKNTVNVEPIEKWFYIPVWKQTIGNYMINTFEKKNCCVFFSSNNEFTNQLISKLKNYFEVVIVVHFGKEFYYSSTNKIYIINPNSLADYKRLFAALRENKYIIDNIVHTWNILDSISNENTSIFESKNYPFFHLLYLTQAYILLFPECSLVLNILAHQVLQCNYTDKIDLPKTTIIGFLKVLEQEYANISCKLIDCDLYTKFNSIEKYIYEINYDTLADIVIYRKGLRWVRDFEQLNLDNFKLDSCYIKHNGVYIITGGLGNIALLLAKHLAWQYKVNIVLIGHRDFPKQSEWLKILNKNDDEVETTIKNKIINLLEIQKNAKSLKIFNVAVENKTELRLLFQNIYNEYGNINGVFHLAGNISEGNICPINNINSNQVEQQFKPKNDGVLAIDYALTNYKIDFCILASSLSSSLGGLGMASYAAANSYLDQFAYYKNITSDFLWLTVDFDGWYFENNSSNSLMPIDNIKLINYKNNDAEYIFKQLFNLIEFKQILISTSNLNSRYRKWLGNKEIETIKSNSDIEIKSIKHRSELESKIIKIWQQLLGISKIDDNDNFFELGGHSLLATQMASKIRREFQIDFPVFSIFEFPTVKKLVNMLESLIWITRGKSQNTDNIIEGEL